MSPSGRCCAFCYQLESNLRKEEKLKTCGKCHKRTYCSRACQREDWTLGGHKFWCGKVGERGVDFQVELSEGKGFGLFALRSFCKGEKIMVERPVLMAPHASTPADLRELALQLDRPANQSIRNAVFALGPNSPGIGFQDKFLNNRMKISSAASSEVVQSALFLTLARVNHSCIGNSAHFSDIHHNAQVEVLVATNDIQKGEEITFSYLTLSQSTQQERTDTLQRDYGFTCNCNVCKDSTVWSKLDEAIQLDQQITNLASQRLSGQAIATAQQLLRLQDRLQMNDTYVARTHFDLFQLYVTRQQTLALAMQHIRTAYKLALRFFGYSQHDLCRQYHYYMESPDKHPSYLCHDSG
jgi:MYND finger/SET domain